MAGRGEENEALEPPKAWGLRGRGGRKVSRGVLW